MKLVGAKLSTIKIPLLLTGIIFGFISASISIIIVDVLYITFKAFYPLYRFDNYIYFVNFAFVLFGLLLGPVGIGFYTKKISLQIDNFK
jgi:cell division protein FtsX